MTNEIVFWLIIAVLLTFLISTIQSFILSGLGSDQSVHVFLANVIKENKFKFFTIIPRIINKSFCGGYPLFLHWMIAVLGVNNIKFYEILLNPLMNSFVILTLAIVSLYEFDYISIKTCILLSLTPQFYHAFSARNFGISARSIGLLLFLLLCIFSFYYMQYGNYIFIILSIICAYLIWGTSTFALQTTIFTAFLHGSIFNNWTIVLVLIGGTIIFFGLHPKYAINYFWHTLRYTHTYSSKLAKIFILDRRKSIWLDFIYIFIYKLISEPPKKSFQYIYENSIIIVLFLNISIPLFILFLFTYNISEKTPDFIIYSLELTSIGIILFFLTTFRKTRFLGEPERYVEIITPFSVCIMAYYLNANLYTSTFWLILSYYVAINLFQFFITKLIKKELNSRKNTLKEISLVIKKNITNNDIKFTSNNDEILKYFQVFKWNFVRYWSLEEKFCGYNMDEAFNKFPYLKTHIVEKAVKKYNINVILFDKINSDSQELFNNDLKWKNKLKILFEDKQFIVFKIS